VRGEGAGEIYYFPAPPSLAPLSLSAFCGDSSVELVAVNPFGSVVPKTALEAAQESLPNGAIFLAAPALYLPLPPPLALGTQARALIDGGAVPGSAASSAAPLPASRQSPRALASGPPHTGRRPCVRASRSPPASGGPSTALGPGGCAAHRAPRAAGGQREPAAAAPPRRSRRFGSDYAPKRSVTCPLSAEACA
jgi:hypothetical protein